MPSWYTHVVTANEILKSINVKKDEFLIANLMPDAKPYVVDNFSFNIPYTISHYNEYTCVDGVYELLPNADKFIEKHKNEFDNPVVLGYLTHLLTDKFWNNIFFENFNVRNQDDEYIGIRLNNGKIKICDRETRNNIKRNDFKMFQNYLKKTRNYYIPKYTPLMLEYARNIIEVPYQKEDLEKIIYYLKLNNSCFEDVNEYKVFSEEEMKKYYDESITYILDTFERIGVEVKKDIKDAEGDYTDFKEVYSFA